MSSPPLVHNLKFATMGKSSCKRSRRQSFEEQMQVYYDKLVYQCRKNLHKQAKISKNFEIQKLIRKLKLSKEARKEKELQLLKDFDLEVAIQECFCRLGILLLNPSAGRKEEDGKDNGEPGDDKEPVTKNHENRNKKNAHEMDDKTQAKWIERILKHKCLRESLEKWMGEVTEFRQWCLRHEDRKSERITEEDANRRKKKPRLEKEDATIRPNDLASSVFVQLGDAGANDGQSAISRDARHSQVAGEDGMTRKKNRPGQRARKAKAMAIQAHKEGRRLEKSVNWRPKKTDDEGQSSVPMVPKSKAVKSIQDTNAGRGNTSAEELHPSWQARKTQQDGIVAFQGTKITFDDS